MQSEHINELAKALAAAQGAFKAIPKNREATVKGKTKDGTWYNYTYKYANLADVTDVIRPVLAKHEIAYIQETIMEGDVMLVKTRLLHADQWIESAYPVCTISGDHQKMGAALSYARRYALCALLGIAPDEDTDGREAATVEGRKSSAEAKRDGDWEQLQHEISECESIIALRRLRNAWRNDHYPHLKRTWTDLAEEEFDKAEKAINKQFSEASNADLDRLAMEHDDDPIVDVDGRELTPLDAG